MTDVERITRLLQNPRRSPSETAEVRAFLDSTEEPRETKLGGSGYPPEVLAQHPELGAYEMTPASMRWPEIPGMVQMVLATFVPDKGWLVTKRSAIYGGRHGRPPLIEDTEGAIVDVMAPELRSGIRAMKARLARED